jgi:hypothetical protein
VVSIKPRDQRHIIRSLRIINKLFSFFVFYFNFSCAYISTNIHQSNSFPNNFLHSHWSTSSPQNLPLQNKNPLFTFFLQTKKPIKQNEKHESISFTITFSSSQ